MIWPLWKLSFNQSDKYIKEEAYTNKYSSLTEQNCNQAMGNLERLVSYNIDENMAKISNSKKLLLFCSTFLFDLVK